MGLGPAAYLVDGAGRPLAATPGAALASGATSQAAALTAGSDYAATPNAQIPKVDAAGNQYAVPMVGTTAVPLQVNSTVANPAAVYGSVSLAWDPTNSRFTPFQVDATGAGVTRNMIAATTTFAPATQINTGAGSGKNMLSIYNGTSSMYFRVSALFCMCPPQAAVTGGLLGTQTSYTTVGMAVYRTTGAHTGGTVVAPGYHDSRAPTDAGIVCRTGATVAGQQSAALRVMDAAANATYPYLTRSDPGMALATFAPGEGVTLQMVSAVGTGGVNFYITAIIAQNTA